MKLDVLADASSKVSGAAAYISVTNTNSKHFNTVLRKSKIVPLKSKLTNIPKLGLQASLQASRIKLIVTHEMDIHIDNTYLWSDIIKLSHY